MARNRRFVYPLGTRGNIIGRPYSGTHRLGNWQSDRAIDIAVPVGTPVYAVESGTISKVKDGPNDGGRFAGDQVTLVGRDSFFYTHLSSFVVKAGQKVKKGALIGYSGMANGVAHLHIGQMLGNPLSTFAKASMPSGGGGQTLGEFVSTAYGPPWGGIQGTGVTANGTDLHGNPAIYGVAVDPKVIPLGTQVWIEPNPFNHKGPFIAFDTGGAIKGKRIDFYDWKGRKHQNHWGKRKVTVSKFAPGSAGTPATPRERPGGGTPGDTGPSPTDVLVDWNRARDGDPDTQFANYRIGPLGGLPGIPNPLDLFKPLADSVDSVVDFLKILAWIINPVNILRAVEFLVGLTLMAFGLQAMMQAYGEKKEGFVTSEGALSRSGLGRVSKELAAAIPQARAVKAASKAKGAGTAAPKARRKLKPAAAPHKSRREALRLRYQREEQVSRRRTIERRAG